MQPNDVCFYCGNPAQHRYILCEPIPGRPAAILVCSVRSSGSGFSRIVLPWTRCQRWAEADGYRRDPAELNEPPAG